jgi:hypothetical protein
MRSVNNITDFSRLIVASGLITDGALDSLLQDFREHFAQGAKYGTSLTAFSTYLVTKNILTCWQNNLLRSGQWKGFFLDQYKLVDRIGDAERCSLYLAEDTTTGESVVLSVTPPSVVPLKDGKPRYSIEPFHP